MSFHTEIRIANDPNTCSNVFLSDLLREHVDKGDPVDVVNIAMMIQQRGETISAASNQNPYAHEFARSNGDGSYSYVIERGEPRNPILELPMKALYERPALAQKSDIKHRNDEVTVNKVDLTNI